MARAIHILFGAGFTAGLSVALGALLLRGLRIRLLRLESVLFAFVAGAACLSLATFVLCAVGQARPAVFLVGGIPLMAWASWLWWKAPAAKPLPPAPVAWQTFFYAGLILFGAVYLLNALAPEASPDGAGYHLGNVLRMAGRHGFVWDYHSIYASFPQGTEMLFLVAVSLGGYSSAALVHLAFLVALPLMMATFGRRFGFPRAALCAGLLVFASPIVGIDGASAYNDVALATVSFAVVYGAQLVVDEFDGNQLLINGLLIGFCCAIKYTGGLVLPLALWWSPRGRRSLWVVAGAALTAGPWIVRNWLWLGNPVAPFLNRLFPNPYYYPGPESSYLADLRHYEAFHHWWQLPVDLAVYGGSITGILGPVFLLAPFALLALRHPLGRRLLLAAAVLAVPAGFNSGARFLIPSLPFLAMAMGIGMENSWGVLPAVAAFQLWACWPAILALYAAPWSWRIREISVQAALGRQSEASFLTRRLPDYVFKEAIDQTVKPGERIFSYAGRPEAYLDRTIVTGYESALGILVQDLLSQAVSADPIVERRWRLGSVAANGIRVLARQPAPADWKVGEIRVWNRGEEVRPSGWRLSASPNPWQAELAFDGSPATRWLSWQQLESGFWVQAEFPRPVEIDAVTVESSAVPDAHPQLEVATGTGQWSGIPDAAMEVSAVPPRDMRKESMHQLKARGIFYLLLNDSDLPAQDFKEHANLWGVTEIQEAHGTRFYRID